MQQADELGAPAARPGWLDTRELSPDLACEQHVR
jgi:hypothetical protein